ncbi:MAG: hypothetical protein QNJ12_00400 [Ilumatobacter sp.]|nr:hypothetical protein [Ilumatobacter sp.]MDJ0767211.1 hypothetical protein [Ilumatobacter sp.]
MRVEIVSGSDARLSATAFTAVVMGGNADELALTRETLAAYAG